VEGSVQTGATAICSSGFRPGKIVTIRRFEDGLPVARARDGDVVTVEFDSRAVPFDPYNDVFFPEELLIQDLHEPGLRNLYLWRPIVPPEWNRLVKTDPFVPKLLSFVSGVCVSLNQTLRGPDNWV
jgi:hypothetical protein